MHHSYSHKIEVLQRTNQTTMITSIAVLVASLIITAMLPTFLLRYVYANQQLFAQPALLEYIPLASFVIGVGYFLFTVIGNFLRSQRIKRLVEEMEMMGDDCNCDHGHDHNSESHVMGSTDSLAAALVKESTSNKKMTKKASTKRAQK